MSAFLNSAVYIYTLYKLQFCKVLSPNWHDYVVHQVSPTWCRTWMRCWHRYAVSLICHCVSLRPVSLCLVSQHRVSQHRTLEQESQLRRPLLRHFHPMVTMTKWVNCQSTYTLCKVCRYSMMASIKEKISMTITY